MTGIAFYDSADMPLELTGRHIVVGQRIGVWPDCMGTAMTAFTHDAIVSLVLAILVTAKTVETVVLGKT